jgi:eukaryotic-like serine/threonine-protein kinase
VPFAQNVAAEGESGPTAFARFSLSRTGVLVYITGGATTGQFTWFDRSGNSLGAISDPGSYGEPAFSPDQKRVVFDWNDSPLGNLLWIFDFSRSVKSRFSFGSTDGAAVWSPDGSRVVFASRRSGQSDLYIKSAAGAGTEDVLLRSKLDKYPDSWSPDGRTIVFELVNPKNKLELWMLSLDGRQASPYLQSEFNGGHAAISPDGHWIAYTSDETGRLEIYVQSFPTPTGGRYPISPGGGDQPSWRRDGKELFYIALDRKLMAVPVTAGAAFESQPARALFQSRMDVPSITAARNNYAAAADGQKFLVYTLSDALSSSPMTAVINWSSGMGK